MNDKLAIDGGKPIRENRIWYGCQWIDEDDVKCVSETLLSPYITCGPKVEELEKKLCEFTGAKYAVAVSNGTAALHCACIAAGIGEGDEVITTPMTFAASANCVIYCGARPIFADIDPNTYNIDPDSIRAHITERTKAIIAVDFTGQVVDIESIREICKEFGLLLIEDAAHSIGSSYNNVPVGSLADITTFSFHPVKTITGGEGGAILTDDLGIYEKLVLARSHGITRKSEKVDQELCDGSWYYDMTSLGFNYRITDFQAALLINQLSKISIFKNRRDAIVRRYNEAFSKLDEIIVQQNLPESDTCRHLYIIRLNLSRLNCTRREFFDAMSAENIQCQVHYIPVYWFKYYQQLGYKKGECPVAEEIYKGIMSIPLYPKMNDEDVEDTIKAVYKCVNAYRKR